MSTKPNSRVATKKTSIRSGSKATLIQSRLALVSGHHEARTTQEHLAELLVKMKALDEQRASLPIPEETQAFGLWPERMQADRRAALEELYSSSRTFQDLVDELRRNKPHYINQLAAD
jgi:hypothetical protein